MNDQRSTPERGAGWRHAGEPPIEPPPAERPPVDDPRRRRSPVEPDRDRPPITDPPPRDRPDRDRRKLLGTALRGPLLTIALLLAGCSTAPTPAIATAPPRGALTQGKSDEGDTLRRRVLTRLQQERLMRASEPLQIAVERGVVVLRGFVPTLHAAERAHELTATLRGVRAVVNELDVLPLLRSDETICRELEHSLATNPIVDDSALVVRVEGGTVSLSGEVASAWQRRTAVRLARNIPGVTAVSARLTLDPDARRDDATIAREIHSRLRVDPRVFEANIGVRVRDGDVRLVGFVGSPWERALARADARVRGVKRVDARGLKIALWARDRRLRASPIIRDEHETIALVQRALRANTLLHDAKLSVAVKGETVVLGGTAPSWRARRAAVDTALGVNGVRQVVDHVRVPVANRSAK